jgi:hypothetical protein
VRATCSANAKLQEDLISGVFVDETVQTAEDMQAFISRLDDETQPFALAKAHVADLSTAQLARIIPFRPMAEAWWKAAAIELQRRAADGEKIPGMKFVEGRTKRRFISESKAQSRLIELGLKRHEIISSSLVTPAKAEKLLRKAGHPMKDLPELLQGLVMKPAGRATLVPITDKRPEVEDVTALAFESVEDENREDEEV